MNSHPVSVNSETDHIGHVSVASQPLSSTHGISTGEASPGIIQFAGSEFLGSVIVPSSSPVSSLPSGSCLWTQSLNPASWDGSRLQAQLRLYDMYRIRSMVLEIVSNVPPASTDPAGSYISFFNPDIGQNPGLFTGDAGVRQALARPGSNMAQLWESTRAVVQRTQQKWYYTQPATDDPALSVPGTFHYTLASPITTKATSSTLANIVVHYVVEVEAQTVINPEGSTFGQTGASANFNVAQSIGSPIYVPFANLAGAGAQYQDMGVVGWATVIATDDTGPGSSTWRTWTNPATGMNITIGNGMTLYFRAAANSAYYFYPDLAAALSSDSTVSSGPDDAFQATITATPAPTVGFKFGPLYAMNMVAN